MPLSPALYPVVLGQPPLTWGALTRLPNMALALRADRGVFNDAAAYFTAANKEYLTIAHASQTGLDLGTTDFSISVWVKRASAGATQVILGKFQGGADRSVLYFNSSNILIFTVNT